MTAFVEEMVSRIMYGERQDYEFRFEEAYRMVYFLCFHKEFNPGSAQFPYETLGSMLQLLAEDFADQVFLETVEVTGHPPHGLDSETLLNLSDMWKHLVEVISKIKDVFAYWVSVANSKADSSRT